MVPFFEDSFETDLASKLGLKFTRDVFQDSDVYLDLELAYAFGDAPTKANIDHFNLEPELKHLLQQLESQVLDYYGCQMFLDNYDNYEK